MAATLSHLRTKGVPVSDRGEENKARPQTTMTFELTDVERDISDTWIKAHISQADTTHAEDPITLYTVNVSLGDRFWTVQKRYSQFDRLVTWVAKAHGFDGKLPAKTWLHSSASSPEVVRERAGLLNAILGQLLADGALNALWEVRFFLGVTQEHLNILDGQDGSALAATGEELASIRITGNERVFCSKPFTVYLVEVTFAGRSKVIRKRYSEFDSLYSILSTMYVSRVALPPFPKKTWLQGRASEEAIVNHRQLGLDVLCAYIAQSDVLGKAREVRFFFELDVLEEAPVEDRLETVDEGNGEDFATARIVGRETIQTADKDKFTIYQVAVQCGGRTWVTSKRYSHFKALNESLVKNFPGVTFPTFPKGTWFHKNASAPDVVAERRVELDAFIFNVAGRAECARHPAVRDFLEINTHMVKEESENPNDTPLKVFKKSTRE